MALAGKEGGQVEVVEDFGSGAISLSIKALLNYEKSSFYIHERKQETEMIEDKICGHFDQIGYFL